jgi:hypothetical protein
VSERQTLEVVARDHRSGSVVLLTARDASQASLTLEGIVTLRPEPGYPEPIQMPVSATITEEAGEGREIRQDGDRVRVLDADGQPAGLEFQSYNVSRALGDRYEVHSAVAVEGDDRADVFAISDIVEITLAAMGLAACLIMYSGQVWLVKQAFDSYRQAGLVPGIRMQGGFWKTVSCRFEVVVVPVDPRTGEEVGPGTTVSFGRQKGKGKVKGS